MNTDVDYLKKKMTIIWDAHNATKQDTIKISRIVDDLLWILNESTLREDILNKPNGFKQTKHDNLWHLKRLVDGDERQRGNIDYEMDLLLDFYFKWGKVVAYTNSGSEIININRKFWDRNIYSLCNTFIHEYSHLVGGYHSYRRSSDWPETFPYWLGARAEKLLRERNGAMNVPAYKPPTSLWRRIKRFVWNIFH